MRPILTVLWLLSLIICNLTHANPFSSKYPEIPLWGNMPAPDTQGIQLQEQWDDFNKNPDNPDYSVSQISSPSITVFKPAKANGSAMLVIPGGGYSKNVFAKEGVDMARWLNSLGVTAFVLKYRLPSEWPKAGKDMAFQDGQRAMRLIRARAGEWMLDKNRLGVIGFSAGGHLAASLGTLWDKQSYAPRDDMDKQSARPDLMILAYAAVDGDIALATKFAATNPSAAAFVAYQPIKAISKNTSPSFLVAASDDPKVKGNMSARFYNQLIEQGVAAELHIFNRGGHGFALRKTAGMPIAIWPKLCEAWMTELGFLAAEQ